MNFEDVRLRSLLLTLALVVTVGFFVTYWPDSVTVTSSANSTVEGNDSTDTSQQFDKAVEKLRHRQFREAIDDFRDVLNRSPSMPEAYLNMGFAHYELQHYKLAVDSFQTAIDLRPSQVNAYWGLAVSLEGLCDIAGAIGAMRTYVHLATFDDPYLKRAKAALWEWDQMKATSNISNQNNISCMQIKK
jgi:outer membrane protein assembly factor BamD (BamD/ComL family)